MGGVQTPISNHKFNPQNATYSKHSNNINTEYPESSTVLTKGKAVNDESQNRTYKQAYSSFEDKNNIEDDESTRIQPLNILPFLQSQQISRSSSGSSTKHLQSPVESRHQKFPSSKLASTAAKDNDVLEIKKNTVQDSGEALKCYEQAETNDSSLQQDVLHPYTSDGGNRQNNNHENTNQKIVSPVSSNSSSFLFASSASSQQSELERVGPRLFGSHINIHQEASNSNARNRPNASNSEGNNQTSLEAAPRDKRNTLNSITISVSDKDLEQQMEPNTTIKSTLETCFPQENTYENDNFKRNFMVNEKDQENADEGEGGSNSSGGGNITTMAVGVQGSISSGKDSGDNHEKDNSRWSNKDLLPVPNEKRTYTAVSYIWFWTVAGSSVTTWSIGGSLLDSGLSAKLAITCIVVGSIIIGCLSFLCGWIGRQYHIGYTVTARSEYGIYGSFVLIVIRLFVLIMWFSIQAYWGGQAMRVLIGAIIPGFVNGSLSGLISESSHLQKNDLISIFIFLLFYVSLVVFVPPERMQFPFALTFLAFLGTMIGLLSWAMAETHGKIGPLFYSTRKNSNLSTGWMVMQGITSVVGTWSGGSLSHSDWTRFAKHSYSPILSQFVFAPIIIVVSSFIGIVVTSASGLIFGLSPQAAHPWNPINLLAQLQEFYHDSKGARAGVFFASLGLVSSQIFIATVLNSISAALDMSALLPKYLNIKRGALLMAPIAVLVQPWQLSNNSGIFLVVLGGFGIFMVSGIGVSIGSFFFKLRRNVSLPDLFCGNRSSIYWYTGGFSIVGLLSFTLGFVFLIPGWAYTIKNAQRARSIADGKTTEQNAGPVYDNGWMRMYSLSSLLGVVFACVSIFVLSLIKSHLVNGFGEFMLDKKNQKSQKK